MKRISFIVLLLFVLSGQITAQTDSSLTDAIAASQNYQFDKAINLLKQAPLREPVRAFYLLNAEYKKMKINGQFEEANTCLTEGVDKYKHLFEEALDPADPDYAELLMYYGALLGLKAQVYMSESKYLQGYYYGLSGIKKVEAAYDMNPDLKDALLAMGTSAFYSGVMAQHYSVVGAIIDAQDAIDKGIRLMQETWDSDARSRAEAGYLLLLIHVYERPDYEAACRLGEMLLEKYPGNLKNRVLYAEALILSHRFNKAQDILNDFDRYTDWLDKQGKKMWALRKTYVKAVLSMEKGHFTQAEKGFNEVIENYCFEYKWQKNLSLLKIGQMADLHGDRKKAIKYYKQVIESKETTQAVLDAKEYIKSPFKHP
jgi:hypothetical protein